MSRVFVICGRKKNDSEEMLSTFNMGVGLMICVNEDDKEKALGVLNNLDPSYEISFVGKDDEFGGFFPKFEVVLR